MAKIVSKKLRNSARDENCTLQIAGVCNYNPATVSLCHLPDESHGMGRKSDDISAAFGCDMCHSVIDGRVPYIWEDGEKEFYMRRGMVRTWRRWIERGLVKIG